MTVRASLWLALLAVPAVTACGTEEEDPVESQTWEVVFEPDVDILDLGTLSYEDAMVAASVTLTNRSGTELSIEQVVMNGGGATILVLSGAPSPESPVADGDSFTLTATTTLEGVTWRTGWYTPDLVISASAQTTAGTEVKSWSLPTVVRIRCDMDGDGQDAMVCGGTDCDDSAPTVRVGEVDICDGIDNNCDGTMDEDPDIARYPDLDGDAWGSLASGGSIFSCTSLAGYADQLGDCDDSNGAVYPDAPEYCNMLDDDCDGAMDEEGAVDPLTWYLDDDRDGWGGETVAYACAAPTGYTSAAGDCDDGNLYVNPRSPEHCDGLDEDCDGELDENPLDGKRFYQDLDGDGYGDVLVSAVSCDAPSGYVEASTDCNDADPDINPGETDMCGDAADGVDDDCNGVVDNVDDAVTYYVDRDNDGYGSASATVTSCTGSVPSGYSTNYADCDDGDRGVKPSADESCDDGADNDCNGLTDCEDDACMGVLPCSLDLADADGRYVGEVSGDRAGIAVSTAGDVDGDGYDDLLIGANGENSGGSDAGAAYVVFGPSGGSVDLSGAGAKILGEGPDDGAGVSVAGVGDYDGDGYDDLLVGAPGNDSGGTGSGCVYLVSSPISGDVDLGTASARMRGTTSGDAAGTAVAALGDTDGDGRDDIVVGAPYLDASVIDGGAAYVVLGGYSGYRSLGASDATLFGESASDLAGDTVAGAGDVNGDGFADILVGAPGVDRGGSGAGIAYVVLGPVAGDLDLADAEARVIGNVADDAIHEVAAGDLDGDGNQDLLLGSEANDGGGASAGAVWVVLGPLVGTVSLVAADDMLYGATASDYAGHTVAVVGDVDGDGKDNALVGAYNAYFGSLRTGAAYLLPWPWAGETLDEAGVVLGGESTADRLGDAVGAAGDVDMDGIPDLILGAPYEDSGGSSAGAAYLVLGKSF